MTEQCFNKVLLQHRKLPSGIHELHTEVTEDCFVLRVPLRQAEVSIHVNGASLCTGAVVPGMLRISSPGEREHFIAYTAFESVSLRIPGSRFRAILQANISGYRSGDVSFIRPLENPRADVAQLGYLVLSQPELDPVHAQLSINGVTEALLARLLQNHASGVKEARRAEAMNAQELKNCFEIADAYMEVGLDLDEWAAKLGMNGPEFSRRFRLTVGQTAYAWFMYHRIEKAKALLSEGAEPLCDIALRVGFSNQSHFTEAFRRKVGTSPARWRTAHATSATEQQVELGQRNHMRTKIAINS